MATCYQIFIGPLQMSNNHHERGWESHIDYCRDITKLKRYHTIVAKFIRSPPIKSLLNHSQMSNLANFTW